jgi:signal transduction histidine kinase
MPMPPAFYTPRLRVERLIASGRVALGVASLFAVWVDPAEPTNFAGVAYALLWAYVAYASATAALMWRIGTVGRVWPAVTHGADLVFFSLFIFFAEGPASPFTVYFVFALISATLRWRERGTFWTAVATLGSFLGLGVYYSQLAQYAPFEFHDFIVRGAYMVVIAILLGYLSAHERRTHGEMWQLASWPHPVRDDASSLADDLLGYAGRLMHAPRVLLAWNETEAPWQRLAVWDEGRAAHERLPAGKTIVADGFKERPFISLPGAPPRTLLQDPDAPRLAVSEEEALQGDFGRRFGGTTVISIPLRAEAFEGRLFFLDKSDVTLDDLLLAEVVAGFVTARLETFYLMAQLRQSAANEERIRLSRDLHDGVLQSFTGTGLRLAAIQKLLREDREAAATALEELQRVVASEQRDFRFFIQELKPQVWPSGQRRTLQGRLSDLATRMEREWDLRVVLQLETGDLEMSDTIAREIYLIVREGLVNAARHGAASQATIAITRRGAGDLAVSIADNGRGFSFKGSYTADELMRLELGPRTLRERVLAMQGTLRLESSPTGARLHMVLPVAA